MKVGPPSFHALFNGELHRQVARFHGELIQELVGLGLVAQVPHKGFIDAPIVLVPLTQVSPWHPFTTIMAFVQDLELEA